MKKVLLLGLVVALTAHGELSKQRQTLKQVERTIGELTRAQNKDRQSIKALQQALKQAKISISQLTASISNVTDDISAQKKAASQLKRQLLSLKQQLNAQLKLLAIHIEASYQLGKHQYLKLLLNQQDPSLISRLSSYYGYINQARSQHIDSSLHLQKSIDKQKKTIATTLAQLTTLKRKRLKQQADLMSEKQRQFNLSRTLAANIALRSQQIQRELANKKRLEKLIETIAKRQYKTPSRSFVNMRQGLPWPVQGKVADLFGKPLQNSELIYNGIRIFSAEKRQIVAVYPGKVVFADWLNGFGLLTIIDHGNGYMTLYANNYSLLQPVGTTVAMNQPIATVGHTGGKSQNGLYFELRHLGKPLNPLLWLKKIA